MRVQDPPAPNDKTLVYHRFSTNAGNHLQLGQQKQSGGYGVVFYKRTCHSVYMNEDKNQTLEAQIYLEWEKINVT